MGLVSLVVFGCGCGCPPTDKEIQTAWRNYQLSHAVQLAAADVPQRDGTNSQLRTDVAAATPAWLALQEQLALSAETQPSDALDAIDGAYTPWRQRRGPAWPGDFWRSFGRDAKELPATLWDDTTATFTNPWTWAGLGAAVAAGVTLDAANVNGCVADHYHKNRSQLNSFWDSVGDVGGNPGLHFAVAGAMYFTSLYQQDVKHYEVSKALINALAINGLTTLALKGVANSESPNGDDFGWPSGHTSSTFCFATVMHEAYGPWVGVPLFAFATFVGYERIDARNHDFHDVISGAMIGIAIGHAVYQNHQPKILGFDVMPYSDPARGTVGIALVKQF